MSDRPAGVGAVVDIGDGRFIAVVYCPRGCSCDDCSVPSSWWGVRRLGGVTCDQSESAAELDEWEVSDDRI